MRCPPPNGVASTGCLPHSRSLHLPARSFKPGRANSASERQPSPVPINHEAPDLRSPASASRPFCPGGGGWVTGSAPSRLQDTRRAWTEIAAYGHSAVLPPPFALAIGLLEKALPSTVEEACCREEPNGEAGGACAPRPYGVMLIIRHSCRGGGRGRQGHEHWKPARRERKHVIDVPPRPATWQSTWRLALPNQLHDLP
jgi:hypothetical protein